jgi:superfamily I DNA/RNA helicase
MIDSIEAGRQRASALHEAALAKGSDAWKPLELVLRLVEEQGFAAEHSSPTSRELRGAHAVFLPVDGLILYRDDVGEFEKAFLIGHELGHALLGDAAGGCEIDPERSAEAAPIGEERVIEHGPRQRRELQMDLFARELLLPRYWVRQLHLQEGLSADQIAERLGAPQVTVAQQLLDALLLPTIIPSPNDGKVRGLNDEQKRAAEHLGSAFLLEAGPGTGKTQTLTARVGRLLAGAIDPRNILVLTFSNKAAAEMSERISGGNADAFAAMWIGTFHAFGLDFLRAFGDKIGLDRNPGLLDRIDAVAMLEDELPGLGLTHYRELYDPSRKILDILAAISRAKDEVCGPERYRELADAMIERAKAKSDDEALLEGEKAREVAIVYARYEELKREQKGVDFGDLVMLPVEILEQHDDVARHYRDKYRHVLVDEYQDVNRASVRLLKALAPSGEGLWAVGDARQSIYRFRGASSHNIAMFGEDFPDAKTGSLVINYRSGKEIVDLYSGFAVTMEGVAGKLTQLEADRGELGEDPELHVVHDKSVLAPAIADAIEEHRQAGGQYRDHCVLVSGNDRLGEIGGELESLGIPVLYLGSLFERPEIRDLLSLLSLASDPRGVGLVRAATIPEFKMTLEDVDAALSSLAGAGRDEGSWRDLCDVDPPVVSAPAIEVIRSLRNVLEGFDGASNPWHVLVALLFDRTRIAARLTTSEKSKDIAAGIAVWQFMNFLRSLKLPWPQVPTLLMRIRRLIRLADEQGLRQLPAAAAGIDAVRLMTIHGSKGLEFPVVHLPGLNSDTMPKGKHLSRPKCLPPEGMIEGAAGSVEDELRLSHNEEQDCLFYVAMSRARDRLRLYCCSHKSNGTRPQSSFIERLGPGLCQLTVTPTRELPEDASSRPVPVTFEKGCSWEVWRLDTYKSCPRRLLYEHVLGIRGAVERTPYKRVHDAVRKLCGSIVASGGMPDDEELERLAHEACGDPHISEHGYAEDFKSFAAAMVLFFGASRRGLQPVEPSTLSIAIGGDKIEVRPDDVLKDPGGGHIFRSIRTGHYRDSDEKKLAARALLIAARQAFPGAAVQVLHLADGDEPRDIPDKAGTEARDIGKMEGVLQAMRSGAFPTDPSAFTCPACSALFVCDALPQGPLTKKF